MATCRNVNISLVEIDTGFIDINLGSRIWGWFGDLLCFYTRRKIANVEIAKINLSILMRTRDRQTYAYTVNALNNMIGMSCQFFNYEHYTERILIRLKEFCKLALLQRKMLMQDVEFFVLNFRGIFYYKCLMFPGNIMGQHERLSAKFEALSMAKPRDLDLTICDYYEAIYCLRGMKRITRNYWELFTGLEDFEKVVRQAVKTLIDIGDGHQPSVSQTVPAN